MTEPLWVKNVRHSSVRLVSCIEEESPAIDKKYSLSNELAARLSNHMFELISPVIGDDGTLSDFSLHPGKTLWVCEEFCHKHWVCEDFDEYDLVRFEHYYNNRSISAANTVFHKAKEVHIKDRRRCEFTKAKYKYLSHLYEGISWLKENTPAEEE